LTTWLLADKKPAITKTRTAPQTRIAKAIHRDPLATYRNSENRRLEKRIFFTLHLSLFFKSVGPGILLRAKHN
jgi:hypothetical protein